MYYHSVHYSIEWTLLRNEQDYTRRRVVSIKRVFTAGLLYVDRADSNVIKLTGYCVAFWLRARLVLTPRTDIQMRIFNNLHLHMFYLKLNI